MTHDINTTYKRKEYGWFYTYIFVMVFWSQFAGVIGTVGSAITMSFLYRIIKNDSFSKLIKIILSILCAIGGIIVTLIVAIMAVYLIRSPIVSGLFSKSTTQYFSTEQVPSTTATSSILSNDAYVSTGFGFKIIGPKDWTVNTTGANSAIEFDNPAPKTISIVAVSSESVNGISLNQYTSNVLAGLSDAGGPYTDLKILNQATTTIDNQSAIKTEVTFVNSKAIPGQSYTFHAIYIISIYKNRAYTIFGTAQEAQWSEYENLITSSMNSFTFL